MKIVELWNRGGDSENMKIMEIQKNRKYGNRDIGK